MSGHALKLMESCSGCLGLTSLGGASRDCSEAMHKSLASHDERLRQILYLHVQSSHIHARARRVTILGLMLCLQEGAFYS